MACEWGTTNKFENYYLYVSLLFEKHKSWEVMIKILVYLMVTYEYIR